LPILVKEAAGTPNNINDSLIAFSVYLFFVSCFLDVVALFQLSITPAGALIIGSVWTLPAHGLS
jgi:hypothetical protein